MTVVSQVRAWQAMDSRGRPTVGCRVDLADGAFGSALAPSGASAGSHEALELRDGGLRFAGRGVSRAVANVNGPLASAVVGLDVAEGTACVDAALSGVDPSAGYAAVGANAVLAVSLAAALAAADSNDVSLARALSPTGPLVLPMPMVNIVSGGAHAAGALDIQDVLVVPIGAESFTQAIEWATLVRDAAEELAVGEGHQGARLAADEGGLGLRLPSNRVALELVTAAIGHAGLRAGVDVGIAIDVAASEFYDGTRYRFALESRDLTAAALVRELVDWCTEFPILSVEDALAEDDWPGWSSARRQLADGVQLIGDDLFVTNVERLQRGIAERSANAVLVKVNQNGTVSGAAEVVRAAQSAGFGTVVSARSGDTEDSWLADLAVGWRAGQIKVGSTRRSERTAKWNRLLEFEALEDTTFDGAWRGPYATAETRKDNT